MLREHVAHVGGGAVAVVGQRLDDHRDALGAVALVDDRLERSRVRVRAGALRDRAVDVVLRHRVRPRLLDRVLEREVVRGVAAALLRRDDDRARELREELAALRVGGALLVLDRRPLAMPGHPCSSLHQFQNRSCTRVSSVSSGWNAATRKRPSRASTGRPSTSASTSTSGPTSSIHGARMKTARTGSSIAADVEVGLEERDLAAERVAPHHDVDEAEVVAVEHDHPGARAEDRPRRTAASASSSP